MDNYLMIILLFLILVTLYFYQETIYEYLNIKRFDNKKYKHKKRKKRKIEYDSDTELSIDQSIDLDKYNFDENSNCNLSLGNISMNDESKNNLLDELSIKNDFDEINNFNNINDREPNLSLNSGGVDNDEFNNYNILD
jgi:hypothetical protein